MASAIVPSHAPARRTPRLAFPATSPQLYGLDDELCHLIEEDSWDFWAWVAKNDSQAGATYYLPRPSWPLHFEGFNEDAVWCINRWAEYSAANGCPMSPGDVVRGMAFMMIDDDEDFRAWRLSRRAGNQNNTQENRHVC